MKILLAFDKEIDIQKEKLLSCLNSKCDFLQFELAPLDIEFGSDILDIPNSFIEVKNQLSNLADYEVVFCFTDNQYYDNYFFHERESIAIYSFYDWSHLTDLPKSNGMLYLMINYLALMLDKTEFRHHENTGCIYDFLWSKSGIDEGMRQAKICPNCLERINGSISSDKQIKIISDLRELMNRLSNDSKWNQDILTNIRTNQKRVISKRKSRVDGIINAVIASPGDTNKIRQVILERLEIQFRRGNHEAHCSKRLIVHGWEDLASQNGYAQDVINEKVISQMDIVIAMRWSKKSGHKILLNLCSNERQKIIEKAS